MRYYTVHELIEKLKQFPGDMPVRISANGDCRDGEFYTVGSISKCHLRDQNTDGDPEEYWCEEMDRDEPMSEDNEHFKYKGKLILIA